MWIVENFIIYYVSAPINVSNFFREHSQFFANEISRSILDYVFKAVCIEWNLLIILTTTQQPCMFGLFFSAKLLFSM